MKLGLMLGYWMAGPEDPIDLVLEAERLGYDSVWTAEAYGSDAVAPLCWMGARTTRIKLGTAVMQISARTPASVAMTAMTIDHLSGGRLILGLGVSGPQVVEGWYGQPFPHPLARTREFVALVRTMLRREGPVTFDGRHYQLPYRGGSGLGKPLKLIGQPLRSAVPIYLARWDRGTSRWRRRSPTAGSRSTCRRIACATYTATCWKVSVPGSRSHAPCR